MIADLRYVLLDRKGRENEIKTIDKVLDFLEWLDTHNLNINKLNINRIVFWLDVWEHELVIDFHD